MTRRTACREIRRYTAAAWRPSAVLLSAMAMAIASQDDRLIGATASPAVKQAISATVTCLVLVVGTAALTRLMIIIRGAMRQPGRDEEAFERLAEMHRLARQSGHQLLEVHRIQWATNAGQRACVIDTANGSVIDYWFAGQAIPPGSFVLVQHGAAWGAVVSWLSPDRVSAAGRHADVSRLRGVEITATQRRRCARQERTAARAVVEAAERLLKL